MNRYLLNVGKEKRRRSSIYGGDNNVGVLYRVCVCTMLSGFGAALAISRADLCLCVCVFRKELLLLLYG